MATEPEAAVAAATAALAFAGVSAGESHTCGMTTDNRAYCWGDNFVGELGIGTSDDVTHSTPVLVAGGLRFRQVSAGFLTTCGVTTDRRAYCWGYNRIGQVGDGTDAATDVANTERHSPVPVVGGHQFSQIETNLDHTCGLSYPDGKAYCWGSNSEGQLGIGSNDDVPHNTPLPVSGGLTFRRLTAGHEHTCGLTTNSKIYCWGLNADGQLGDGTEVGRRKTPRLVTGGLAFGWVDAGRNHTCAITTESRAFCWGYGKSGERGDGSVTERIRAPRAVLGGHVFTRVSAGAFHTCGVTPSNQAWCWGNNVNGALGDGSTVFTRTTPRLVAGGLALNQVSAGAFHTCGRTTASVGYCWGNNVSGELGNGTTSVSLKPSPVSGPN
jgi:alpha-tubulin suppressor-like RCC1 family protein